MAKHETPEVRRAQILEAALGCFAKRGYHATRMDDVVHASGLSKGALYWHFENKEELFVALFEGYTQAIFAAWDAIDESDALELLRREAELTLGQLLASPELLGAWSEFFRHPKLRPRFAALYEQSRSRLSRTVRRGIEQGSIGPCDPEHVATMLTGLIEGLLLQLYVDPDYDLRPAWSTVWAIVSRGLAASAS